MMNAIERNEIINTILSQTQHMLTNQQLLIDLLRDIPTTIVVPPLEQLVVIEHQAEVEPIVVIDPQAEVEPIVVIENRNIEISTSTDDIDDSDNDYLQFRKLNSPEEIRKYISIRKNPNFMNLICLTFHCNMSSTAYKLWVQRIHYHQNPQIRRRYNEKNRIRNQDTRDIARHGRTFTENVNNVHNRHHIINI
jgi:hypothetical protein